MKKSLFVFASSLALGAFAIEKPFGENVYVFTPQDSGETIDATIDSIFKKQHHDQFGTARYAFLFKPGDYSNCKTINLGYYTQILGLGRLPTDTRLPNVKTPAALKNNNATCNFWVGIENVTITEKENNEDPYFAFQWAVSQAAPARRLCVERKAVFDWFYGWCSGGFIADSYFAKVAGSYSQQQYYTRNCTFDGGFFGVNWNNFFQGCDGAKLMASRDGAKNAYADAEPLKGDRGRSTWNRGGNLTMIDKTGVVREKPFLYLADNVWKVFVPALRRNAVGPSWTKASMGEGKTLDLATDFFIASPDKSDAKAINAALEGGKHVLFTPGIYHVAEAIRITKPNTILLGIGEATIVPENAWGALQIEDVDGVTVAGLIFDAERASHCFVRVGNPTKAAKPRHEANPTLLQDVIYRVGGTGRPGKVEQALVIDSDDVILDHTWVWRADHGEHTGWFANTSKNGIVVNGDGVIGYGLFVEHFQEYDVLWNGEDGKTYFLQNEKCYDPQGNEVWMSHDGKKKGYASYKVADHVKKHYAVGLGVYDVFINTNGRSVHLDDAIEVPDTLGVMIENACIVEIANGEGPLVGINHIVNGKGFGIKTGKGSGGGYAVQCVTEYCNGKAVERPDYYTSKRK